MSWHDLCENKDGFLIGNRSFKCLTYSFFNADVILLLAFWNEVYILRVKNSKLCFIYGFIYLRVTFYWFGVYD